MSDLLFPEAESILLEAAKRHGPVLAYAIEAIDLAHIVHQRVSDLTAPLVPGVPGKRRVRNAINDDAWRYFRCLADPLVAEGQVRGFRNIAGGEVVILPDGLHARLKKGNASGVTTNYPTLRVQQMAEASHRLLFSGATPLDVAVASGVWFEIVFVAGESMGDYRYVGLRFAATEISPMVVLDPPSLAELYAISPAASEIVANARAMLAS